MVLVRIKLVRFALVSINDSAEHYDLVTEDGRMVMADAGRNITALFNRLPLDRMLGVVDQFRDTVDGQTPHVVHGANLDVAAAMNV